MRWLSLALFLPANALGATFFWEWSGAVDRFELKLDTGVYVSVGLPPSTAGTYKLLVDPALTGSHSAVIRACTVASGCTPDSNTVAFTVSPTPKPAAPTGVALVANVVVPAPPPPPPPQTTTESPNLTKVTLPGVGSIVDSKGTIWTLGPKNPAVEGGVEFQIVKSGIPLDGAATYLCYFNHLVYAASIGSWYAWNGTTFNLADPIGC